MYGSLLAVLVFLLKWLQWKFLVTDNAVEIYVGLAALLFTALGGWLASRLISRRVQTVVIEKEVVRTVAADGIDDEARRKCQFSAREYEVLELLVKGYSNAEIAEQLFLSLSTIKTHVSNILFKMDVKSRARAIEKAKRLKITR